MKFPRSLGARASRRHYAGDYHWHRLGQQSRSSGLAEEHEEVYAVVGWHPNDLESAPDDVRPNLRSLCEHPKVVAVGETGIDHYRLPSSQGRLSRGRHPLEGKAGNGLSPAIGIGRGIPTERGYPPARGVGGDAGNLRGLCRSCAGSVSLFRRRCSQHAEGDRYGISGELHRDFHVQKRAGSARYLSSYAIGSTYAGDRQPVPCPHASSRQAL